MIQKHVGLLRQIYHKRKDLKAAVLNVLKSEEHIHIAVHDKVMKVSGQTSSVPMNLYLLGRTIGISYLDALRSNPNQDMNEFLQQPLTVAIAHIKKELGIPEAPVPVQTATQEAEVIQFEPLENT